MAGVPAPQPAAADTIGRYRVVADSGREMTVANGVKVTLERGAILRVRTATGSGRMQMPTLEGGGAFTLPLVESRGLDSPPIWTLRTRGGLVTALGVATFHVAARGDTTTIHLEPSPAQPNGRLPVPSLMLGPDPEVRQQNPHDRPVIVRVGETARIVRGLNPVILR